MVGDVELDDQVASTIDTLAQVSVDLSLTTSQRAISFVPACLAVRQRNHKLKDDVKDEQRREGQLQTMLTNEIVAPMSTVQQFINESSSMANAKEQLRQLQSELNVYLPAKQREYQSSIDKDRIKLDE